MKVSILVPVYNEEENLEPLHREIARVIDDADWEAEVLFVDDGSRDGSYRVLEAIAARDPRCRVIRFARNFGQTAAMAAAFDHATGDVLVPLDADLQNDPADIPRMLGRLEDGFDVVSGWRRKRQDRMLSRRLPSIIANRLISRWTGVRLHDYGCTLKAYRAGVLRGTRLYGEMHRFVPVYAAWRGARVTEMEVNHRPRIHGVSKYGLNRTLKVLLDLITLKLLGSYSTKPSYMFGGLGAGLVGLGMVVFFGVAIEKVFWDTWPHKMSGLLLTSVLVLVGVLLVMMGLLAELIVRTYHESQGKAIYVLASEVMPQIDAARPKMHTAESDKPQMDTDGHRFDEGSARP